MNRTIKLGIAITAVLALSAIAAAAAQAGSLDLGAAPALLTGEQGTTASTKIKATVTSASGALLTTAKCSQVSGGGTTSTASVTEFTLTPSFGGVGGCELGGLSATIAFGSCTITLSGVGTAALTTNGSIVGCTSPATITQGTCVLSVTSTSTTVEKVTAASVAGPPKHIVATLAIQKVPVTGGSGCPANLQAAGLTGDLNGTLTIKAFSDAGGGLEGSQVSLEAT
jgi:hypothetical protein